MLRSVALLLFAAPLLLAQGTVEGTVLNSVTRAPVPGAIVELYAAGAKEAVSHTVTGASGAYRFADLPPGEYTPSFDADHFYASHASDPWCKAFKVTAAGETLHIDAELDPITKLSGRVLDADGKPLAGVRVETFTRTTRQGIMSFTTDKDGYFHPPELQPGAYFLLARPNHGLNIGKNVKINEPPPPEQTEKKIWAPTFYPNVTDATQAEPIQATGGELNGYDIRLRSVPAYRIRGVVRDESGSPAAKVPIELRNADLWYLSGVSRPDAETVSGDGGVFEFTEVGPGNWRISAEFKRGNVELRGFVVTLVSRHDEEDVQLRLNAPFSMEGSVQPDCKAKDVGLQPVDGPMRNQAYGAVNSEHLFRISGIYPGRYKIIPPTVAGHYISQIRLGEQDVTGQVVDLAPGAPPIRLTYRSDTGSARGTVENGANAMVVLFPKDETYLAADFLATVRCGPDGKFELTGLRPGDYSAMAFNRVELDLLEEPAFVQRVTRGAVSVHVEPGQMASVELRLAVWPQ
ncbi:conserved exported hypothetical protein [Candidatus Sulfopaludibacter sp. SbA3]|nr:conserved exported hypothetical protein [Candidatus Sulfopaludibacter sp. SbA3]